MFPNQKNGRFSVAEDGTFRIERVQFEDEGEYVCQALNVIGSAKATARIDVRRKYLLQLIDGARRYEHLHDGITFPKFHAILFVFQREQILMASYNQIYSVHSFINIHSPISTPPQF